MISSRLDDEAPKIKQLRQRVEDAVLMCQLVLAYVPEGDATLAQQRLAIGVLRALGAEFDQHDYLARLAAASNPPGRALDGDDQP